MFRISSSKQNSYVVVALALVTLMLMLTSLYYMRNIMGFQYLKESEPEVVYKEPLPGHWLKTEASQPSKVTDDLDSQAFAESEALERVEALREAETLSQTEVITEGENEEYPAQVSYRHLNRELDAIYVLNLWTDQGQLKVVSITALNKRNKKPALVVISLSTVINDKGQTLQELYMEKGRDTLLKELEKKLEVSLHNYVHIDHKALYALSDILGTLELQDEEVTMAQALEDSAAGIRTNDETIVREVAKKIIQPSTWLKLPSLLKVFRNHLHSNLEIGEMLHLLNYARQLNLEDTRKTVLPGEMKFADGKACKIVNQDAWQNILYEATR